jgi:hypothetical protein
MQLVAFLCVFTAWLAASVEGQKGLTKINKSEWSKGGNHPKLDMFYYAPPSLPPNSPIVVAVRFLRVCLYGSESDNTIDPLLLRVRFHVRELRQFYARGRPI